MFLTSSAISHRDKNHIHRKLDKTNKLSEFNVNPALFDLLGHSTFTGRKDCNEKIAIKSIQTFQSIQNSDLLRVISIVFFGKRQITLTFASIIFADCSSKDSIYRRLLKMSSEIKMKSKLCVFYLGEESNTHAKLNANKKFF